MGIIENGVVGIFINVKGVNVKGVEISFCVMLSDDFMMYVVYFYVKIEMIDDVFGIFGSIGDIVYEGDRLLGFFEY